MKKVFLIIFSFLRLINLAQTKTIDSLQTIINTSKEDTNKVLNLFQITYHCYLNSEYNKAVNYSEQSITLSKKLNYKKGIANSYNLLGAIYLNQGNYPEALKSHFTALKIFEEINDSYGLASCYNNIGIVFNIQNNYTESLKYYKFSLKKIETFNDKEALAACYNNIGEIYRNLNNNKEALNNFLISLKLSQEVKDNFEIATSYNNVAVIYDDNKNYLESLKNHFASLKLREEINDLEGCATSLINIGSVYTKLNKLKDSENYLNNGLMYSKDIGSKGLIKEAYLGLVKLDSVAGNFKNAFEHHKLYVLYKDSVSNEETKEKSIQINLQYQFEKKELIAKTEQDKKDVLNEKEKQKQIIILYSVSLGLVLVLILALFILRGYRQKQKANFIITQQKNEVENQKHLVEEKHKEITDSINYAERIQRSFLASKKLLDENLNEYFVFFQPKDVVSGDFYWASKLVTSSGVEKFVLVTADSTGHGVPGAIMSLLNVTSLESAIKDNITDPSEILNHTRNTIIERLKKDGSLEGGKDGMDCSCIVLNIEKTILTYSAANNPIWVVRSVTSSADEGSVSRSVPVESSRYEQSSTRTDSYELIELAPDKMPVGKHDKDHISFTQNIFNLQKGDVIYTLTDGMPDQFGGPKGKKFMYKKLKELLISISQKQMHEQKQLLINNLNDWRGDLEQVDDVCISWN